MFLHHTVWPIAEGVTFAVFDPFRKLLLIGLTGNTQYFISIDLVCGTQKVWQGDFWLFYEQGYFLNQMEQRIYYLKFFFK